MVSDRLKFIEDKGYCVDRYVGLSELLDCDEKGNRKVPIDEDLLYLGFVDNWSITNGRNYSEEGGIGIHFSPESIIRITMIIVQKDQFSGNFANLKFILYGEGENKRVVAILPANKYIAEVNDKGTPVLAQNTKAVLFLQKPSS